MTRLVLQGDRDGEHVWVRKDHGRVLFGQSIYPGSGMQPRLRESIFCSLRRAETRRLQEWLKEE